MPDGYEDVCDARLWMMGLEERCRRVLSAMDPGRRARFRTARIVSWETVYGPGDPEDAGWEAFVQEMAQRPIVYALFTGPIGDDEWFFRLPFTEHMLKDEAYTAQTAALLLRQAEGFFADREGEHAEGVRG